MQLLGLPQVPPALQVSTPFPEHCVAPCVQAAHAPLVQASGHAEPLLCQVPVLSHVCGCRPLHCVAPGEHVPVHPVALQT